MALDSSMSDNIFCVRVFTNARVYFGAMGIKWKSAKTIETCEREKTRVIN